VFETDEESCSWPFAAVCIQGRNLPPNIDHKIVIDIVVSGLECSTLHRSTENVFEMFKYLKSRFESKTDNSTEISLLERL